MAILGATLIAFAFGLLFVNQSRMAAAMDRELMERVAPSRPPFGFGGPGGPPGPVGGQPFQQRIERPGPPLDLPRNPDRPPPNLDPESYRLMQLRRPRQFDTDLKTLSRPDDVPMDMAAARSVLETGRPLYTNMVQEGEKVRILTMPWFHQGEVVGIAQVARETRDLDNLWRSQLVNLAIFLPCSLVVAALGALFLTSRAMRPISAMQASAASIGEGNLRERLNVEGQDEFAELGHTFNAMVGKLEASFNSLQDSLENQRRFTADASHELRTPLTRLKLATSLALQPSATPEDQFRALSAADKAAESMTRLVQQLLLLAKADSGQLALQRERTDLRVVASEAIEMVVLPPEVSLQTEFPEHAVYAEIDSEAVHRVVTNLLENAYRYAGGGCVSIEIGESGEEATLSVTDTGPGVSPEHLPHLGERFYRTDYSRNVNTGGSGLGLSICKTVMEQHGGWLEIQSKQGKGARFTAYFPKRSHQSPNQTTSS